MISLDLRFYERARAAIEELRTTCAADLESGGLQTYDEYRERTGYLRGLREARAELDAIHAKMTET